MFQKWTEKWTEFTFWRTLNWTQFTFLPNELELNLVHFLAKWTGTELSSHFRWTSTSLYVSILAKKVYTNTTLNLNPILGLDECFGQEGNTIHLD